MSGEGSLMNGLAPDAANDGEQSNENSTPSKGQKPSSNPLDEITNLLAEEMENEQGNQGYEGEEGSEADNVQQLQAGDGQDGEGADTADAPEEQRSGAERLRDLVEELGTSFEQVYKDMKIPVANDREVTLGELKDAYQDREALVGEVVERREALEQQRADNLRERQIIDQLLPHVAEVPEGVREQVKQQYETALARETASLHAALPHLKDSNNFEAFRNDFVEYMGNYGFNPAELTIADHRLIVALNEGMEAKKTLAKLKELKPVQSTPKRAVKQTAQKPTQANRQPHARSKTEQLDRISRLLGG